MARRLGFFERVGRAIRNAAERLHIVAPPEAPELPEGPRRRGGPPIDPFAQVYVEETLRRPGTQEYQRQVSFIRDLYGFEREDRETQLEIWREYLKFNKSGGPRRNDPSHPFWRYTGIDPRDFDWHGWREAMGYRHGGRKGRYV